jgi:hypothetical protein
MDNAKALARVEEFINLCGQAIAIQNRDRAGYRSYQAWSDLADYGDLGGSIID